MVVEFYQIFLNENRIYIFDRSKNSMAQVEKDLTIELD